MIRWWAAFARVALRAAPIPAPRDEVPLEALHAPGFVAIDVETTGLNPRRDRLVAVAAIPFVGGTAQDGFVTLVNPRCPIPASATAIHGIADADVAGAPEAPDALRSLDAACADRLLVGHDVAFDLAMLAAARTAHGLPAAPMHALCTRRLTRTVTPHPRDTRLEVAAARLGVATEGRHTADGDARMAGALLLALLPALRAGGARSVGDLFRLARAAPAYD